MTTLSMDRKIRMRAAVNEWISVSFPDHRQYLSHSDPHYSKSDSAWSVDLGIKNVNGHTACLGKVLVSSDAKILKFDSVDSIIDHLDSYLSKSKQHRAKLSDSVSVADCTLMFGDGLLGAQTLEDREVDLLLTDPPYGISKMYTCEKQIPRRLRKDGRDFIMPKGNFGEWDVPLQPREWLEPVLPKVGGWFVSFCAQAQIGEYQDILSEHRFNAIGTLVWHKTNPVPFNHRYKPINAWEAVVVAKRPGAPFNGSIVHNVFKCKSPSPQERIHPTQKPLKLMEEFITMFCSKSGFVFDPFAGSATTLLAANNTGRKGEGYENDMDIFLRACTRLQESVP